MIKRNPYAMGMADRGKFSQAGVLEAIQQGESFVYAILTKELAVKVGVTTNLADRKNGIGFGGTKKIMGFRPGDYSLEQEIHAELEEHRIPGTREYYYPMKPVLFKANWMREYWGIEPLPTHYLPRVWQAKFHRRVEQALADGTSVFK